MQTLSEAIQRNNQAVERMLLGRCTTMNNPTMPEARTIFRDCFALAKRSLTIYCDSSSTGGIQSDDSLTSSSSCPLQYQGATLLRPSSQSVCSAQEQQEQESCELLFSYQKPLYFSESFREYLEEESLVDPIVLRFVPTVVMFNMALCFQYCTSSLCTRESHHARSSLAKAQHFFRTAALLIRDGGFPPAYTVAKELELLAWNNLLQVSVELGDIQQGAQEAAHALQELRSSMVPFQQPEQLVLLGESDVLQVFHNLLAWQLGTIESSLSLSSSEQGTGGSTGCFLPHKCAPAA